jgi:hypothetical protein
MAMTPVPANQAGLSVDQVAKRISAQLVQPVLVQAAGMVRDAMESVYHPIGHGRHKFNVPGPPYTTIHTVTKAKGPNEARILAGVSKDKFYVRMQDTGFNVGGMVQRSRAGGKSGTTHTGPGVRHVQGTRLLMNAALAMHDRVTKFLQDELPKALQGTITKR